MEICVNEFAMTPKRFIAGTKGSYGFCTLDFKFSDEWKGLAKKVTFYPRDDSGAVYLLLTGDEVKIPQEVMRCEGVNRYVVSGCRGDEVLISITGEIDVLNSLSPDGDPAEEPTPSQMEQVMGMMQTAVDTANSVREDADNGVFKGEKGEKGDTGPQGPQGEKGEKGDPGEVTLEYAHKTSANAIKGTASGEVVKLDGVSSLEHEMSVKLSSKNLIPFPYIVSNVEKDGISITVNDDRSITVSGMSSAGNEFVIADSTSGINLEHGVTYTLSGGEFTFNDPLGESVTDNIILRYKKSDGTDVAISFGESFTWDKNYTFSGISFSIYSDGCTYDSIVSAPQLERGTTATDYTPYIKDISTVKVKKFGKNLFDIGACKGGADGVLTNDGDIYTLTNKGADKRQTTPTPCYIPANTTITISIEHVKVSISNGNAWRGTVYVEFTDANGNIVASFQLKQNTAQGAVKVERDVSYVRLFMTSFTTEGDYVKFKNLQFEKGEVVTEYEPYIEPTEYPVNVDGTVEGVTSLCPTTTLMTDTAGAVIGCEYNKDTNKVIESLVNAIISLGGNV